MTEKEERRQEKRVPVNKYCSFEFVEQEGPWDMVQMKDISVMGLGFVAEDLVPVNGDKLRLTFSIMNHKIKCIGEVASVAGSKIGVRFVDIKKKDLKFIEEFVS